MKYFGGVEGGATHSKLLICDENGEVVASTTGLGTNHWMVGIPECARRIIDMIERAKDEAYIPQTEPLECLGLSLSGCEQDASNRDLEQELRHTNPHIAKQYIVTSDTVGSIFTASPMGGLVVISGTGSNTLLRNPDGTTYGCGGWGNFLGDEGSAWWISHRAIKMVFDDMDNFMKAPYPVNRTWDLIRDHFDVETRLDLLDHCYGKFDKPYFAGLCKKLAAAAEEGDDLCMYLFEEAGRYLARSIRSLLPKVQDSLVETGYLSIVCVGSVWLSWELFRQAFVKELNLYQIPFGLKLLRITKVGAYGAVYLAADAVNFDMPRNYDDNYKIFHYYNQQGGELNGYINGR